MTITKSTGGRIKVADAIKSSYFTIPSLVVLDTDGNDVVLQFTASGEKLKVVRTPYTNITNITAVSAQDCIDQLDALLV